MGRQLGSAGAFRPDLSAQLSCIICTVSQAGHPDLWLVGVSQILAGITITRARKRTRLSDKLVPCYHLKIGQEILVTK